MKIFNAMDLHKRTGWRLEDADKMVEQLGECNIRTPVADRTLVMKMWNKRAE